MHDQLEGLHNLIDCQILVNTNSAFMSETGLRLSSGFHAAPKGWSI